MSAAFMVQNLGLRHPDMFTRKLAVNVVLLASRLELDPQTAYDHVVALANIADRFLYRLELVGSYFGALSLLGSAAEVNLEPHLPRPVPSTLLWGT